MKEKILYITSTFKQNHIETKPLMNFWNENKYQITNDFKIYDYVSLNKDKLPDQSYIAFNINLTEIYDICFKCKKIFLLKRQQYDLINHEHNFFKYVLHGYTKDSGTDYYNNNKKDVHLFEYKDQIYLKKKVLEEKKYINELKNALAKNKLEQKYLSRLKEIELEIKFFNYYYEEYNKYYKLYPRKFQNLFNIFNHKIIPFKLNDDDLNDNKLNSDIKNLNDKLISTYSLNIFENKEN